MMWFPMTTGILILLAVLVITGLPIEQLSETVRPPTHHSGPDRRHAGRN